MAVLCGMECPQYSIRLEVLLSARLSDCRIMFSLNQMTCTTLYICTCSMKKVPIRRTGAYRPKKSTEIVADTVANVIAALLSSYHFTSDPECYHATIRALAKAGERKDR